MDGSDHLENLIGDYLDGVLDQKGEQELAELLAKSADARKLLASHMRIHGAVRQLGKASGIGDSFDEKGLLKNKPAIARRTRVVAVLAGLAACVAVLIGYRLLVDTAKPDNPIIAKVEDARGATLRSGEKEMDLQKGVDIRSGETIRTTDIAVLRFSDGTTVLLDERSDATFLLKDGAKHIDLHGGLLQLDVAKQPTEKPLVVQTPKAKVTVLGTKFLVEASSDYTEVEVSEGVVRLEAKNGEQNSLEAKAGVIARVDERGRITNEMQPKAGDVKNSGGTIVYWDGKKRVHVEGCKRLSKDPNELAKLSKMTVSEALKRGFPLCSRCPGSTTPGKDSQ